MMGERGRERGKEMHGKKARYGDLHSDRGSESEHFYC
jgi:hypothetical protein